MVVVISAACKKNLSTSSAPVFFTIDRISQNIWDKEKNVAKYRLREWISSKSGSLAIIDTHWFTLQEEFQVGDTLILVKK